MIVYLGGDEKAAQTMCDTKLPALVDALDTVAYVTQATPVIVQIGGTEAHAL